MLPPEEREIKILGGKKKILGDSLGIKQTRRLV